MSWPEAFVRVFTMLVFCGTVLGALLLVASLGGRSDDE